MKTGILLINLGTPDAPSTKAVRRYLREFLSDPRVIDLPTLPRWLLLNLFILPLRPKTSAKAYKSIWHRDGSPLLLHSEKLANALEKQLGDGYQVALGMRYGQPSINSAVTLLNEAKCDKIIVLPLFPQYSSAATGSAIEKALDVIRKQSTIPNIILHSDFYNQPEFILSQAAIIRKTLKDWQPDLYLFSYHGLPKRQLSKNNVCENMFCQGAIPCPKISSKNRHCYRAQCYETSRSLAQQLNLTANQYQTSFQSRLGRLPWIKPYTDMELAKFAEQGIKNIAITCPSFICDCLETLEEIGIQAKEQWQRLGGEKFQLIPCVNNHPLWIDGLVNMINPVLNKEQ